jgi:23S rRNA pseudouridine2605 synthase
VSTGKKKTPSRGRKRERDVRRASDFAARSGKPQVKMEPAMVTRDPRKKPAVAKVEAPIDGPMRLQRYLSQAGVASRRAAEALITEGRVEVNGKIVTELGTKVDPYKDLVKVSGKLVRPEKHVYILFNKPRGCVTTLADPQKRPTILDWVKVNERVYPVGRLDFNTEGALMLTNDGDLANALMHPRKEVPKTYHVKLQGDVDERGLQQLRDGVMLDDDDVRTAKAQVEAIERGVSERHGWLEVTITEGRNRQIHRMMEAIGQEVLRLQRVAYAGLTLEGLRPGRFRFLEPDEIADLRKRIG